MSIHSKFIKAQPVNLKKPPIVLRFKGLWPRNLRRFKFHDERRGGDLSHVNDGLSKFNNVLAGDSSWDQVIRDEIRDMRQHNFEEHVQALKAKSRLREAREVKARGPVDPWRAGEQGPLREGILTVNKSWFGGSGRNEWDPKRLAKFRDAAMKFLCENFPGDQLRFASGHLDEEAYHIHFVVAAWTEKTSANRGRQILLQPSANPLLKSYEHAQDLAGMAFSKLGIQRGERRAEAQRRAREAQTPVPEERHHVPPSQWRAEERQQAQAEKIRIVDEAKAQAEQIRDDARTLSKAAVRKSRKRAIKEARARKRWEKKETAIVERRLSAAEANAARFEEAADAAKESEKRIIAKVATLGPTVDGYQQRANQAKITFNQSKAARKLEQAKLAEATVERDDLVAEIEAKKNEVSELVDQALVLVQRRSDEEELLASVRAVLTIEEGKLKKVTEDVAVKVAEADATSDAIETGLDMIADGELELQPSESGGAPRLVWGGTAPQAEKERRRLFNIIKPTMPMVTRLARLVACTVDRVLAKERQKLQQEASYVFGSREAWEHAEKTRLNEILGREDLDDPA